ncbi:HAD family phosphatase [Dickeya sp. CFBP 2040]|uniref:HAD family phosphatase n=1 Tax=Dickeya poaceiphila TaxID=568768 RepID=A0A5B8IET5_9GAMM|nr:MULTISPECIES: HAD family phosphatase [Dickeya]NKI73453.1 HAD family phosphatase [Dickeya sp. CFBP 2040]QDX31017.1 HAD family phosphatase [Dickeya poaceiphila]
MKTNAGLLFDLDGTLLDTDSLHLNAFNMLLADFGKSVTIDYYNQKIMGAPMETITRDLFPQMPSQERHELGERKEALFREQLTGPLEGRPGVTAFFEKAKRYGVGICIVTNAPRESAEMMLRGLHLLDAVDHLLIGAELPHSKPNPYPYQEAMRRLGITPDKALAFEDSGPGVQSASAAGIFTFGLKGALDENALLKYGASAAIADFTDPLLASRFSNIVG